MAMSTAKKMCELQGPLGEWCWQYDSFSGRVVSRYPVYSVHQHAMGPMMLFAAGEATGCDFSDAVHKGLAWISGNNELRRDFVEPSLGLVWRCIYLDADARLYRCRLAIFAVAQWHDQCLPVEGPLRMPPLRAGMAVIRMGRAMSGGLTSEMRVRNDAYVLITAAHNEEAYL